MLRFSGLAPAGKEHVVTTGAASPDGWGPARVDEEDINQALARRDWKAGVTLLMQRYGQAIYRFCRQMIGDDALAEDVHQLTFTQAFTDLPTFSGRSLVRTWLFSIARHRCSDALKARRRRSLRFQPLTPEAITAAEKTEREPAPDERMDRQQMVAALEQCLERLAPSVRMVVLLRYAEGFSYEDLSRICGERAGTLQARVARAIPVLRECLEQRGARIP